MSLQQRAALTGRQKAELARLERAETITPFLRGPLNAWSLLYDREKPPITEFDAGMLRAFAHFGHPAQTQNEPQWCYAATEGRHHDASGGFGTGRVHPVRHNGIKEMVSEVRYLPIAIKA